MSIYDEPKVDCHNHVFDPARFAYRDDTHYRPAGQETGSAALFLQVLDAYGVQQALVVGPNSGYGNDNRCLLDAIAQGAGRLKGVAVVDHDASLQVLSDLQAQGIVGVAFNPSFLGVAHYLDSGPLLDRLQQLGMLLQVQVERDQLPDLLPLLDAAPSLPVLIDHCGKPEPLAGLHQPGFEALLALGRSGRAAVKLSGFAKFSHEPHPHADVWPYVRALVEAFTLDACVWGSDWPYLRATQRIDYGAQLKLIERLFPAAEDRRKLLWDTPGRWFGWSR
ncbi:amidohydrolase family protein [Variovorax ginsengisoli]|uniref:TIM-barrel fold metal-dependent hydrolase n=1 Tax=Variovorax ginsengisoli TaxID=363844 RepID=A0ABT9S4L1_9BURK|nr:amidohydrolase family protein [Variovorax ginsengisoli]MDP9898292.1 putative TIM-barrel fold metal-dependent hydrolase [Variovorax ginsengisoli]